MRLTPLCRAFLGGIFPGILVTVCLTASPASAAGGARVDYKKLDSWAKTMCGLRAATLAAPQVYVDLGPWTFFGPQRGSFDDVALPAADAKWTPRDWKDGTVNALDLADRSTIYLRRSMSVMKPASLNLGLGSDDSLAVWLDGKQMLREPISRGADPDQNILPLTLDPGKHEFTMAVYNIGGGSGFYFSLKTDKQPFWEDLQRDYPEATGWLLEDLGPAGAEQWFNCADESANKRLVELALDKLKPNDSAARTAYQAFLDSRPDPNDPRWLETYLSLRARPELVAELQAVNFDTVKLAVKDCIATFGKSYKYTAQDIEKLESYNASLPQLAAGIASGDPDAMAKGSEAAKFARDVILANPLLDFNKLLVLKRDFGNDDTARRVIGQPAGNPPLNSHTNCDITPFGWDNSICVLSDIRGKCEMKELYRPQNGSIVRDVDLDFDAKKIMFSSIGANSRWALFEMNIDGSGLHQITPTDLPDVDFFDSCYLPNGGIVTASTANYQGLPCENGGRPVVCLYRIDPDGTIQQLTFDQDSDQHPAVLNDGRVLYQRWEYSDIPHYFSRRLFSMNPDGTNQMEYYGSGSMFPTCFKHALPVPNDPRKVVGILGSHHGISESGRMVIADPGLNRSYPFIYHPTTKEWGKPGTYINIIPEVLPASATGFVQEIPHAGENVVGNVVDGMGDLAWPNFVYPHPLSDKYFIVSMKRERDSRWGIYLADTFNNMTLIKEMPGAALFEPIPFRPVKRPPVIVDRVNPAKKTATVYINDIYRGPGLAGVPRGAVKKLRLFSYHFAYNYAGGHDSVGIQSGWDIKRILGTVPVLDDGSAIFEVPANTPISVQPLDDKGRSLQLMRSWFIGRPGETVSCVGCHESNNRGASPEHTKASVTAPFAIEPFYGGPRPYSYRYEVQPVVDKYCVSCHDGKRNGVPSLAGDEAGYNVLNAYVHRPGPESDTAVRVPYEYHASTSLLVQMLEKGHHSVKLDKEAWDRIYTWIDLNAPKRGQWGPRDFRSCSQASRRKELAIKFGGSDADPEAEFAALAEEYSKKPPVQPVHPAPEIAPAPPIITAKGFPFSAEQAVALQKSAGEEITREVDLGGPRMKFVRIPAGEFLMGSLYGLPDERPVSAVRVAKPFWMGVCEVTNGQYALFDARHDTRYYDEDGKDHTFPGYIGNHEDQPVARVSWNESIAFCKWLSKKTGLKVTLPTEAQWEWAARAGTPGRSFFGDAGTDFSTFANLADRQRTFIATGYNGGSTIHIRGKYPDSYVYPLRDAAFDDNCLVTNYVGQYQPNPWGLLDIIGNVSEWTRSNYAAYPYNDGDGRNDPGSAARKVARGGSWFERPADAGSAVRYPFEPYQKVFTVGFRLIIEE